MLDKLLFHFRWQEDCSQGLKGPRSLCDSEPARGLRTTAPKGSRGNAAERQVHAPKTAVSEIYSLGLRDQAEGRGETNWVRIREPRQGVGFHVRDSWNVRGGRHCVAFMGQVEGGF